MISKYPFVKSIKFGGALRGKEIYEIIRNATGSAYQKLNLYIFDGLHIMNSIFVILTAETAYLVIFPYLILQENLSTNTERRRVGTAEAKIIYF